MSQRRFTATGGTVYVEKVPPRDLAEGDRVLYSDKIWRVTYVRKVRYPGVRSSTYHVGTVLEPGQGIASFVSRPVSIPRRIDPRRKIDRILVDGTT